MWHTIENEATKVIVPYVGEPWIVQPIKLRENLELVLEPGVIVLNYFSDARLRGERGN